jgi:hypothetical protein
MDRRCWRDVAALQVHRKDERARNACNLFYQRIIWGTTHILDSTGAIVGVRITRMA